MTNEVSKKQSVSSKTSGPVSCLIKILVSFFSFANVLLFWVITSSWFYDDFCQHDWLKFVGFVFVFILLICFLNLITLKIISSKFSVSVEELNPRVFQKADGAMMAVYVSLYVISISISQISNLSIPFQIIILILLFGYWFLMEQTVFFNPFLTLIKYKVYEVVDDYGFKQYVITNHKHFSGGKVKMSNLIKISEHVLLERGDK
ncbi:MAG: hypothetical protein LBM13_04400 [Candidatus Ancillula sp.]|jgi:hypothetical protein|nr:hypothetical protein [Candidatus Ancillula sp.]